MSDLGEFVRRPMGYSGVMLLVDETHLAMADVALAAGYDSVRRFNDAFSRDNSGKRQPRAVRDPGTTSKVAAPAGH